MGFSPNRRHDGRMLWLRDPFLTRDWIPNSPISVKGFECGGLWVLQFSSWSDYISSSVVKSTLGRHCQKAMSLLIIGFSPNYLYLVLWHLSQHFSMELLTRKMLVELCFMLCSGRPIMNEQTNGHRLAYMQKKSIWELKIFKGLKICTNLVTTAVSA